MAPRPLRFRNGLAITVVITTSTAGCNFLGEPYRSVDVSATNDSDRPVAFFVHASFVMENGTMEHGNVSRTLDPGQRWVLLFSFERPCERRLMGDLTLDAGLDNGTRLRYVEGWTASRGCGNQICVLEMENLKASLGCRHGD